MIPVVAITFGIDAGIVVVRSGPVKIISIGAPGGRAPNRGVSETGTDPLFESGSPFVHPCAAASSKPLVIEAMVNFVSAGIAFLITSTAIISDRPSGDTPPNFDR